MAPGSSSCCLVSGAVLEEKDMKEDMKGDTKEDTKEDTSWMSREAVRGSNG